MSRNVKRTLSLVLALIMICSTMGVMAFAADDEISFDAYCFYCEAQRDFKCIGYQEMFNSIVACPLHDELHDAEEWYCGIYHVCVVCNIYKISLDFREEYVCLI